MNKTYYKYINKVVKRINCSNKYKKRIREDLNIMLDEKSIELNDTNPYNLLGDPENVAEEFAENMGVELFSKYEYVSEKTFLGIPLIQINNRKNRFIEYQSKKEFMGVPLIHINNRPFGVAKGIIAVGSMSIGIISLGGVSFGVISLGGLSIAILLGGGGAVLSLIAAFGGVAIAGLIAFGGIAISGYISIGGAAIAKEFAYGGYARAKIALGGKIHAKVGFYQQSGTGEFVRKVIDDPEQMKAYIFDKIPNVDFIVKGFVNKFVHTIENMRFNGK